MNVNNNIFFLEQRLELLEDAIFNEYINAIKSSKSFKEKVSELDKSMKTNGYTPVLNPNKEQSFKIYKKLTIYVKVRGASSNALKYGLITGATTGIIGGIANRKIAKNAIKDANYTHEENIRKSREERISSLAAMKQRAKEIKKHFNEDMELQFLNEELIDKREGKNIANMATAVGAIGGAAYGVTHGAITGALGGALFSKTDKTIQEVKILNRTMYAYTNEKKNMIKSIVLAYQGPDGSIKLSSIKASMKTI